MTDQQAPMPGYQPTTTHAAWGSGDPHLLITGENVREVYHIVTDVVKIGSTEGSDVLLEGIDAVHATILHDDRDEYLLTMHGAGEMNTRGSAPDGQADERIETLRTGARFTAGDWAFVFVRAEYADHGRPYGGRQGGELSDQMLQPPRPDYSGDEDSRQDTSGDIDRA